MKVLVTGQSGFVGRHVVRHLNNRNHIVLDKLDQEPEAIIHLAWAGLPNYESPKHFSNISWQMDFLRDAIRHGIRNITVAGTCLETVPHPPLYALAKLALRALLQEKLPEMRWARLWYLYGEGQPDYCLLPKLRRAIEIGQTEFTVINGERDFINVSETAEHICTISESLAEFGIIDVCSGVATPVIDFCNRHIDRPIQFTTNYPVTSYEPYSFHGDRTKLDYILEHVH